MTEQITKENTMAVSAKCVFGLCLAIGCAGLVGADESDKKGGQDFAPKNGMCTIVMPDGKYYKEITRVLTFDPNPKTRPGTSKIRSKLMKTPAPRSLKLAVEGSETTLADKTTSYTAASVGVPAIIMRDIPKNRRFEVFRNVIVDELKWTIANEKDVPQDSVPGKEYEIEKPDGFAKMRVHIIAGWVIYVVAEAKSKDDLSSKTADAFFQSFKMTEKAQELFKELNKEAE